MRQNRTNLVLGLLLIVVGGWMIITNQVPAIHEWILAHSTGSVYTIGAGVLILLIGLFTGAPGMAIPAAIVAGIGGILYYQDLTNDYILLVLHVDAHSRVRWWGQNSSGAVG